eukprot:CAMPEP_0116903198 /NCGR_PEP_ID=MMETSP0467-20121206/10580_1 /TAXON_ID=283647 /ORGANISM="Mesodinium pulex, Strain SPMC105" /LENGTH=224 /DNA_ID=CAMNT_0004577405 /DNA_START=605 /DNA_END=1281 /DNA_ORIENTATION=-
MQFVGCDSLGDLYVDCTQVGVVLAFVEGHVDRVDHGSVDQSGLVLKEVAVFEVGVQHGFESGDGCVVVVLAGSVALLACEYCAQSQRLPASLDVPEQVFGADFFPEVATDHVVNGGGVVQVPGDHSASQVAAVSVPQIQIFDLVRLAGFNEALAYDMKVKARRPEASFWGRHQPPVKMSPSGMVYLTSEWMSTSLGSVLDWRDNTQLSYLFMSPLTVLKSKLLI